jgi:hypothetical protein
MTTLNNHLFVCACSDVEHQFVVSHFPDQPDHTDPDDFTYINIHLTCLSFWQRVVHGIRYILGQQSRFGAFGEILLTPAQCDRLASILKQRGVRSLAQ